MALTKTSLAAACSDSDLKLRVTASTGAIVGGLVLIGDEFCYCTSIDSGSQIGVRSRGSQGGRAKAHANLAPVTFGLGADFGDPPAGAPSVQDPVWNVIETNIDTGQAGALDLTTLKQNTEVILTKATAAAFTTGSPTQGQDGIEVRFLSSNAVAHVITLTPAIGGKVSATFAAGGASITFRAQNGAWTIAASGGVTLA